MSCLSSEYGDSFERRGREGFAEGAKEVKEKNTKLRKYKIEKIENNHFFSAGLEVLRKSFFFGFPFFPSFLRPLRNLRALCVQKLPAFALTTTTHPTGRTAQ
jgi:hypothetical protein